jgi:hypothetical protein
MKFLEELTKPTTLSNRMGNITILSFRTRTGNSGLSFGKPRDETITVVNTIARGRSPRVRTASPISIRICCQSSRGRGVEMQTKFQCTANIPEDTLHESKVRHARSMHMKTNLLNRIRYVGVRQSEVLNGASNASVVRGIRKKLTVGSGELGMGVNRSERGVTVSHTSTLKNICSILTLGQEKTS